ncbi:uncharacterized protein LOC130934572 [Arachis stenosperma]|uniref:uncharacterized protein LOC130934572 n=1 Tax=Arachis stenosperma TaxID=217475 RepID=UPI0025AD728F|nr:uncharacterized protein LOC130934572 [Arachis stenosperma]
MARNFDDMFNEALYAKRRRQDNTFIDNWIDEYLLEDSEEEDIDKSSIPTPRRWINRDRKAGHDHLFQDYFADETVYNADVFRRRFRMRKHVFLRIVDALSNIYPYFQQRVNATGRRGLSSLQKYTVEMQMLAYGVATDGVDDYVRIGESTTIECLEKFVEGVILVFEDEYLRKPNPNYVRRLLQMAEGRGFPDRSPVFDDILNDRVPVVNYTINGNNYTIGYYLADGIYPEWATFVKSISKLQGKKCKLFAQYQEGQRKDVERAFGVLQARFAIIRGLARFWEKKKLANIMRACIILHNMIVEDERDTYAGNFAQDLEYDDVENGLSQPQLGEEDFAPYHQFLQRNAQLRNRQQHRQLKEDLIEHIWQFHIACRQL